MTKVFGSFIVAILLLSSAAVAAAAASPAVSSAGAESSLEGPVPPAAPSGDQTGVRDAAAMVLVGTALIGLASAVRRAV